MGCCIIGALILSRCFSAFDRVQRFVAPLVGILRFVGILRSQKVRSEVRVRGGATALVLNRPLTMTVVAAEIAILATTVFYQGPRGLPHADHILSLLQWAPAESAAVELPAFICKSEGDARVFPRVDEEQEPRATP